MLEVEIALLTFLGSALTGLVSWLIYRRRTSGTVKTSEAASLWQEGAAMRENLAQQVVGLRIQLTESSDQIKDLLHEIAVSNAATANAREETRRSREETSQLRAAIEGVHREIKTGNALSLAVLADNAESRRIQEIPEADRTDVENEHLNTLGIQSSNPVREKEDEQ